VVISFRAVVPTKLASILESYFFASEKIRVQFGLSFDDEQVHVFGVGQIFPKAAPIRKTGFDKATDLDWLSRTRSVDLKRGDCIEMAALSGLCGDWHFARRPISRQ
jgi:hypothetical protein